MKKSIIIILSLGYALLAFKPADVFNDKTIAKVTEVKGKPVFVNATPVTPYDVAFEIKIKVGGFSCPSVADISNALVKYADKQGLPYDAIIMGSGSKDLAIRFK